MDQSAKAANLGESVGAAKSKDKELVGELELSVRTRNALIKAGIKLTDQLKSMSEGEILAIKGLGKKGLGEIKSIIQ
jgi:DNA-directed RNA polymerase alpha subunit